MRNEAQAFAYQPEDDEPVVVPVEAAEKKSAVILQFPKKEVSRKEGEDDRDSMVKFFESQGIIDRINGLTIFDIEGFLNNSDLIEKFQRTNIVRSDGKLLKGTYKRMFEAMSDMEVISKDEYLKSIESGIPFELMPLFNIPESTEEAFNVDKIKNKKYYLNYWDLYNHAREKQVNWDYDISAKNGNRLPVKELALATELVRNFGLKRGNDDIAMVINPENGGLIKLSAEFIKNNIITAGNSTGASIENKPAQYLIDNCPHILQKGILKTSDFRIRSHEKSGEIFRKEEKVAENTAYKMIKKRAYYIGRDNFEFNGEKIPKNEIRTVVLDENKAGIVRVNVHGGEDLICVLNLLDEPMKASSYGQVGKEKTQSLVEPWLATKDNPEREDEKGKDGAYAERMRKIHSWTVIKKISTDFSEKCGIGIHHELSWREQQWLVSAAYEFGEQDYARLLAFGEKYGSVGLKTFLSCEYGLEHGKEILRIGENLSLETAKAIFAKYNEISSVAENSVQNLINNYLGNTEGADERQYQKTSELLLRKSKDLLLGFSGKMKTNKKVDEQALLLELEKLKIDTVFLTSILKSFAKENSGISFEDFKGLSFETVSSKAIENEQDISQMVSIAQKNYASDESMQKLVVESLQEGLENENSQFYILRHNEEIVAFLRFDDKVEYFYAGSFNVDTDYRGSAIGEVMMREAFNAKAAEKSLKGISDPRKIICSKYIEEEGFIIDEILYTEFEGKKLEEVNIVRDDKKNKAYEYRVRYRLEDLLHAYERQEHEFKKGDKSRSQILKNKKPFLLKFDKDSEMEKFMSLSEKLMQDHGYVISRYLPVDKTGKKMLAAFEHKL